MRDAQTSQNPEANHWRTNSTAKSDDSTNLSFASASGSQTSQPSSGFNQTDASRAAPSASESHWIQMPKSQKHWDPLVSSFIVKLALSSLAEDPDEKIDDIAAAQGWFDHSTAMLALDQRDSLRAEACKLYSEYDLTEAERQQVEIARLHWLESYMNDKLDTKGMQDSLYSVPDYSQTLIENLKKTKSASEAAASLLEAERVLSDLAMYRVTPEEMRNRLFSSVRQSGALGDRESEATVKLWFDKHRLSRWQQGFSGLDDVQWVEA